MCAPENENKLWISETLTNKSIKLLKFIYRRNSKFTFPIAAQTARGHLMNAREIQLRHRSHPQFYNPRLGTTLYCSGVSVCWMFSRCSIMLWETRQFAVHIHGWIHIKIFFVDDFYRFFITGLYPVSRVAWKRFSVTCRTCRLCQVEITEALKFLLNCVESF